MTSIMSIAMWNTIRWHSSEFHLTDFSCSAGSFSAITPWLPNRGPGGEPVVGLGLVGGRGHPCPQPRVGEEPQQRHGPHHAPDLPERLVDLVLREFDDNRRISVTEDTLHCEEPD